MKTLKPQEGVIPMHLLALPVFKSLTGTELEALARTSLLRMYERGDRLFEAGEPARELCCLVQGGVRVLQRLPDGVEKVIHLTRAPALVAEGPVLLGQSYPASAECVEECIVVAIPQAKLKEVARKNPDLPWHMMAELCQRVRELTGSLRAHAQKSASSRVASYLVGLSGGGAVVELPAPKKDVASFLGLRPESLSRALAILVEEGAIEMEDARVRIRDPRRLLACLEETGAP